MEKTEQADLPSDAPKGRGLLYAGLAAPVVLTVAIVLAGRFETGYSHISQFVSELGAVGASHQKSFNYGGLFLSGLLTFLFALGLYVRVKPRALFVTSSVLVALAGFGRLVAGIFPCDAGCVMEDMSISAAIHASAGFVALTSGAFAPLFLAVGLKGHRQTQLFRLSVGLGSASVVLVIILFGFGKGHPYTGAIQRLILAALYVWVVAVALGITALQPDDRRRG
jgi:hypothetical membrane protein